ncbi:MAG: RNA chaperone Hfq [Methanothrix sp.]|nr:RNA chaperone Hfq [Methanothrix sp.]
MDGEPVSKNQKKHLTNGFIPNLKDKIVTIRLVFGGQPITGTLERYNPYEILIQTAKGPLLVFKHSIATMEPLESR